MARSSIAADGSQVACDRCGTALVRNAAYCDSCGARTRKAVRQVRIALRIELLFFGAIALMVLAFAVSQVHH